MQKIQHITQKTTRDKVMSYLSEQAVLAGRDRFDIPFNRQELADYLSVERSALSATLSDMKRDGLIDYHKNSFRILKRFDGD
jgi:CRP-like cAMP-binding protein